MNCACEISNRCTTTNSGSDTGPHLITSSRLEPSDTCGDPNPSISWRHAGSSTSCLASTLTTRGEPSTSATSPPAKSPCVRSSYGTPQPTLERQFPETRRIREVGGATRALLAATQENLLLHVFTGEPGDRLG